MSPIIVAVTFIVSTVTLFAVHLGEKVIRFLKSV